MEDSVKPHSYINHWIELRMWLTQLRIHGKKLTPNSVLNRMDEIELDAYRKKEKEDGIQRG